MAAELRLRPESFKDYFLIMQVHPEADGAMVDAAYWHLARRYSEEAPTDSSAKKKLDDLNEAYHVLGSAALKTEYLKLRADVLGENALPVAPLAPDPEQPLTVMQRQRARPRDDEEVAAEPGNRLRAFSFTVPAWQNAVAAMVILVLAGAALVAEVYPPLVAGLVIFGLALTSIPLARKLPRVATSAMTMQPPKLVIPARSKDEPMPPADMPTDAAKQNVMDAVARFRTGGSLDEAVSEEAVVEDAPVQKPADEATEESDRLRKSTEAMVARLRANTAAAKASSERAKDIDYAAQAVDYEAPSETSEAASASPSP